MGLNDALLAACAGQQLLADLAKKPAGTPQTSGVVIWPDGPVRTPSKLNDSAGTQTTVYVCHCIGLTPAAVFIAERKLALAVASLYRQQVDGQCVQFPVQDWAQPLAVDDDVSPALYDLAVEWRLRTTPA